LERRDWIPFVPATESEEETAAPAQDFFSSAPRARREVIHRRFQVEKPPEGLREPDTPWIIMLGPSLTMAMGSLFSSVITINNILSTSGSVNSALPSLVTSIVMVMGSAVWPIVGRRVQKRSQVRRAAIASDDYEDYLKQLAQAVEAATQQQKQVLEENNPLLKDCVRMIEESSETLWERSQRHKDFLEVMIGRGDVPLHAEFSYPERGYHSEISQSARDMYALVAGEHLVKDVPITIPLRGAGIVGVIGDRPKIISFTRALLLELTSMHNYEDLKIVFIW
jgi:S-DNA-T family DNA segregation ATPase FtsK/SpoIIIE